MKNIKHGHGLIHGGCILERGWVGVRWQVGIMGLIEGREGHYVDKSQHAIRGRNEDQSKPVASFKSEEREVKLESYTSYCFKCEANHFIFPLRSSRLVLGSFANTRRNGGLKVGGGGGPGG